MASQNMYVLRVRLSWAKGVWREIALLGDSTLADLHRFILDAFEWSEEDTYRYYGSLDITDDRTLYRPDADQDFRHTQKVTLDELGIGEGEMFMYVFGEGEKNQFPIKVMILDDPDPRTTYPDIVDENGESPAQELAYE